VIRDVELSILNRNFSAGWRGNVFVRHVKLEIRFQDQRFQQTVERGQKQEDKPW